MTALFIILVVFSFLLFAPRALFPWVIAGVVPVYVWLWWLITRPLPTNNNWGAFDHAIIGGAMVISTVILGVARLMMFYRQKVINNRQELSWLPAQFSCLFVTIWGLGWLGTPMMSQLFGAGVALIAGLLTGVAAACLALFIRRHRVHYAAVAVATIGGIAATIWWPLAVAQVAEDRSGNQPYCLLVAKGAGYRVASKMLDLTPLVMRGSERGGSAFNYHGQILIAGDFRRNWSYLKRDFRDKAFDNRPPTCRPELQFARRLPWF